MSNAICVIPRCCEESTDTSVLCWRHERDWKQSPEGRRNTFAALDDYIRRVYAEWLNGAETQGRGRP